jgi:hypothetical protein
MQMLKEALAMSPLVREEFARADRARLRELDRQDAKSGRAEERISAAEAKRLRRRERNLIHCS